MTTLRHRTTVAALMLLAAGLSACASDPTSPLAPDVSLDGDTITRAPTIPWANVTAAPTIPWANVTAAPTIPWARIGTAVTPTSY